MICRQAGEVAGKRKETLVKQHVFRVTIHRKGNTREVLDVIARDDLESRRKAIAKDDRAYKKNASKPPRVVYCEIVHVCIIDA